MTLRIAVFELVAQAVRTQPALATLLLGFVNLNTPENLWQTGKEAFKLGNRCDGERVSLTAI